MIEVIILISIWLISTEIVFWKVPMKDISSFMGKKLISMLLGVAITIVSFGTPFLLAVDGWTSGQPLGNIVYVWYYGTIGAIALFFGINYLIYKKVKKK